ncbi:hypothetical protein EPUL_004153, partial [Erysiphe pulchra]
MIDSMDVIQDSQALPTENEQSTSPHSPYPRSPTPYRVTLTTVTTSTTKQRMVGRKIRKPTILFKRTIPDKTPPNGGKKNVIDNAFLPKELAEVIATRQRRERAGHARILICATVISCIDSTLASFEDEIEKEVSAFKAYLGLAITKFAAADSSPTPPQIPSHT